MATKSATTRTNGTKDPADQAVKGMSEDYDALKADIAQLRKDIQSLAGHSGEYVKDRSSSAFEKRVERGRDYAEQAGEKASSARDYMETKVRDNPLASVGIAFGTGVLLAALRRK